MEQPYGHTNIAEDYFANGCSNNVECIMPMLELLVNFKINGIKSKKSCIIYAEKIDFKGLIQIRLTEKCDQRRMYITTVDSASFTALKQDQSLHVTFTGFVENLVRLLQDCQNGKLEIYMLQAANINSSQHLSGMNGTGDATSNTKFEMQFLELRPFKNLMHLSLPCRLAPLNVVLFYMNGILDALQSKLSSYESSNQQLQHELHLQQRRQEQLEAENSKLRENMKLQGESLNQKHMDELQQLQESLRKTTELHHSDNERNRKTIVALQTQIEQAQQERLNLQAEKGEDLKHIECLKSEMAALNAKLAKLRTQDEHWQKEISALKNEERKAEMHLNDARKLINELQERIKKYDKSKADIIADLEAEKKISQTKRQALEVATEEISKANEIIYKQAQELLKLKKTIAWRTEIALEQEKAIREKEKELAIYENELKQTRFVVNNLRDEIPHQLDSLREFANTLETKYKQEIEALRLSLQAEKENVAHYKAKTTGQRV